MEDATAWAIISVLAISPPTTLLIRYRAEPVVPTPQILILSSNSLNSSLSLSSCKPFFEDSIGLP